MLSKNEDTFFVPWEKVSRERVRICVESRPHGVVCCPAGGGTLGGTAVWPSPEDRGADTESTTHRHRRSHMHTESHTHRVSHTQAHTHIGMLAT